MPTTTLASELDLAAWERALYAFLAEKERRSISGRTVEGISGLACGIRLSGQTV